MWRKIIYDYRLKYMNDLFEIEFIFLWSKSYVPTSSICMGATLFGMRRLYQFYPYRQNIKFCKNVCIFEMAWSTAFQNCIISFFGQIFFCKYFTI